MTWFQTDPLQLQVLPWLPFLSNLNQEVVKGKNQQGRGHSTSIFYLKQKGRETLMEVLKDKDCTINTPVVLGVQDSPIYGKWCLVHPACFLQIVQNTLLHWLIVPGFFNCFVRSCLFCIHSVCHSAAWPPCHLWTAPSLHLNFPGCFNLLFLYLFKIQAKYNVYLVSCQ